MNQTKRTKGRGSGGFNRARNRGQNLTQSHTFINSQTQVSAAEGSNTNVDAKQPKGKTPREEIKKKTEDQPKELRDFSKKFKLDLNKGANTEQQLKKETPATTSAQQSTPKEQAPSSTVQEQQGSTDTPPKTTEKAKKSELNANEPEFKPRQPLPRTPPASQQHYVPVPSTTQYLYHPGGPVPHMRQQPQMKPRLPFNPTAQRYFPGRDPSDPHGGMSAAAATGNPINTQGYSHYKRVTQCHQFHGGMLHMPNPQTQVSAAEGSNTNVDAKQPKGKTPREEIKKKTEDQPKELRDFSKKFKGPFMLLAGPQGAQQHYLVPHSGGNTPVQVSVAQTYQDNTPVPVYGGAIPMTPSSPYQGSPQPSPTTQGQFLQYVPQQVMQQQQGSQPPIPHTMMPSPNHMVMVHQQGGPQTVTMAGIPVSGSPGSPMMQQYMQDNTILSEILARGPEALKAYKEALESGKTKNRRLLIMVVGPARSGKTSLLKSLNGEEFHQKEDSTVGIQLQRTFFKSQENCWSKESTKGISYADCMADIIHKNLQDDSEEIHDENFAKARKESTEKSVESSKSLSKKDDDDRDEDEDDEADDDVDIHGNDDDKMNAIKVESEEMNEEANEELENQEYISEKSTANLPKSIEEKLLVKLKDTELSEEPNRENEVYIKSLDFAGQAVYNVIHPIFLTSKAVFILVYNLKNNLHDPMKSIVEEDGAERELVDPFEMTNMENLKLWLSCISSYTDAHRMAKIGEFSLPLVFLAGTHADKFDGNLEDAKEIIRKIYKSLSQSNNQSGRHVVSNQIYTVNNRKSGNGEINDESVRKLKADIEEVSKSLPHMNEDIPVNWLWFEEELSNLEEKEDKKYITIDEALKIANKCKVNTSAESKEFLTLLNYLHDSKTVIYFEETKKVFIDTEWLVKVFTKVIEVRPFEKRDGCSESWDKLEEKGVLDRALVEHVWKGLVDERNTIDSLLLIMEKFSLICRWNTSEGEEVYLVPCMLCNSEKREDIAKCLGHENSSTMVIRFDTSHVSLGIFPRLFVAIAEEGKKIWPNLEKPELHKNFCRIFEIGKERNLDICIIQSSFQTICVTVCNIQNIDGQQVAEFCQHFRKLLDQIFGDMWRNFPWMQNMKFEYGILCPVCTTSPNKCKSHKIEGCTRDTCIHFVNEKELSVDTPKCKKYVANLDNVIEEKAYVYWFPRQVVGPTFNLTENQKRWLVIGICLNIVLLPPLRKFLGPNILNHYNNLKASYNIHNQVHGRKVVNDVGRTLNYRSINNNGTIKKVEDYDYKVTSAVDLAKLYLQSHMAKFTGFNDTCDLSAVLGVLSSASVFSADIQDFSSKVRKDVRNEWGHCNFESWDETKFEDSFDLMHSLLKALKLSSEDEKPVADQLTEWKKKCVKICMANTVLPELVKDIEDKVSQLSRELQLAHRRNEENVAQLSKDVEQLAISQEEEVCRVVETLVTVQYAILSLKQRMRRVENRVENVEEEVKRAHERIDRLQK